MHIVIFGANGRVGSRLVRELVKDGHEVRACVHGRHDFETGQNLEVIEVDIYDANGVARAVQGQDVVVSTLGSWGTKRKDVLSSAMRHIIPAMKAHNVSRIITLTGAGAFDADDTPSFVDRAALAASGDVRNTGRFSGC